MRANWLKAFLIDSGVKRRWKQHLCLEDSNGLCFSALFKGAGKEGILSREAYYEQLFVPRLDQSSQANIRSMIFDCHPLYSVWLQATKPPLPSTSQNRWLLSTSSSSMLGAWKPHGGNASVHESCSDVFQAHLPKRAISPDQTSATLPIAKYTWVTEYSPAPKHIIPNAAITTLSFALLITLLNMNSCAINSTRPVYINIPALMLSNTPSTISPVCDPGEYVSLTPKPTAIDTGVDTPYPRANKYGVHRFDFGQGVAANRDPRPSPSNVW